MEQMTAREKEYDRLSKYKLRESKICRMHYNILRLRARAYSYSTIALELGLSESTVRTILDKYDDLIDSERYFQKQVNKKEEKAS